MDGPDSFARMPNFASFSSESFTFVIVSDGHPYVYVRVFTVGLTPMSIGAPSLHSLHLSVPMVWPFFDASATSEPLLQVLQKSAGAADAPGLSLSSVTVVG